MNDVWNLDPIYRGFDDPAFAADLQALRDMAREYNGFAAELGNMESAEGLKEGVLWQEKLTALAKKLIDYAQLRQAVDTRDNQAGSYLGQAMQILSTTAGAEALWKEWSAKQPGLMETVRADELLKTYEFFFENLLKGSVHLLGEKGEEISARLSMSGSNAWSEMHSYLTSTLSLELNGETLNLSAVRNLACDEDPAVRKAAYEAEMAAYDKIKDPVAFALNSIKLETISDSALRGYASPLDRSLEESYMKRETLEAMLEAVKEYLPKFRQYLKAKAKALGYGKGLPWYDLFAPMGKSASKYTVAEAKELLVSLFATFDEEMAQMVAQAFDEGWIDFYPRSGKMGGAFCAGVDCIGQSRIMTNFDGTFGSVVVLAHELGHAFHEQCVRPHRLLNHNYSMPVAETASTFNECVVNAAALARAEDKEEKLALLESQLRDSTQVICDIYSRFLFEAAVFEKREEQFLDAQALCDLMLDAQEQSYGDGLDPDVRHSCMWICKPHYYGPIFYNFPYAFGALFARGLYAQYEKEGAAFVPKYKKLLYTTTVATAEDAAMVADIDLTDKAFWSSALESIAGEIDLFCQLIGE